jgi:hypothetical protein
MSAVGYEYLRQNLKLSALEPKRPALVKPVTRITNINDCLSVPKNLAPADGAYLDHVLFALKHEGTNLAVLAQTLPHIPAEDFLTELRRAPNGGYIRKAAFLWETFTGRKLEGAPVAGGAAVPLFDPDRYYTGPSVRNPRWRVDFNGLGSMRYCATVERTPTITELLDSDVLTRARKFMASLPAEMQDRALSWAYLHETQDSFAIEKEAPSEDKAQRFVKLLRQAHERHPLSEEYLVELQNICVTNPLDQAASYRVEQNHLQSGLRGAAGVTYVPPPPDMLIDLMTEWLAFANVAPTTVNPIIAASIISFGFVFLHPFMDGNGRLSRFLIHHALCSSGKLENGLLLPVSIAMKRQEQAYLEALQDFSRPVRERWQVRWVDEMKFDFEFQGDESIYQFWDATPAVEFIARMADLALEVELRAETLYLQRYDKVLRAVNERYDVRGSTLSTLVMMCLDNAGSVSRNRRKQFAHLVPETIFDVIEAEAKAVLSEDNESKDEPGETPDHA